MKEKIILIGAGGHTRSCIDVIESEDRFSIFGLIASPEEIGQKVLGYEVIGSDVDLERFRKDCKNAFVTVGQIRNSEPRKKTFDLLKRSNFEIPIITSPIAHVSKHSKIGEGSIIMHHAIVNSNVQVGENCIINSKVLLEHDVKIGNHSHISTGAILNGEVTVGDFSFIGSGSVVRETIRIGSNCFVGMASKVLRDIPDKTIYKTVI
ncbi:acetyltransferase [Leptospira tipperaryensis]|uniref:Acetyltransferase n=1 Tax=Leptospira tipperaryensis TaxID=2564040 RepID=A0A1D7UVQ0_9LEPT|nr:acetyltransferase [Leptospira tipperaryensis]AOP33676.1 acetyltransferase [Leptospira tipperaryensis]